MENKPPLSKPLIFVILGIIFVIAIGGYILFFQSQKRIAQKDHEYELLKTKSTQSEEGYNDLQKKYDSAMEKIKQLTKDNEASLKQNQELKTKHDDIQIKFDALMIEHEKLTKELKEKLSAPAATAPATPTTTPTATPPTSGVTEPKSSSVHPIQELNQQNTNLESQPPVTPAVTVTPPSPPPDPEKKASLNQSSAVSAGVALGGEEFHCPTSETVTKNLSNGNWEQGSLTWYVDYTRRPLNENEPVQKLFQILFDGQTVACYYELDSGDQGGAWIVIKGSSKGKLALKEMDGWTPCPTKECEASCAKESLNQCHFTLQSP